MSPTLLLTTTFLYPHRVCGVYVERAGSKPMEKLTLQIPENVSRVRIPAGMVQMFVPEDFAQKNILVVKKTPPYLERGCGARRRYRVYIDMLPRGGVRVFPVTREEVKDLEITPPYALDGNYPLFLRQLPYATILVILDRPADVRKAGYLTFERNSNEWKLAKDQRTYDATVVHIKHGVHSRTVCAAVEVVGDTPHVVAKSCCATQSTADALLIIPRGGRAAVILTTGDYRGPEEYKIIIIRDVNGEIRYEYNGPFAEKEDARKAAEEMLRSSSGVAQEEVV